MLRETSRDVIHSYWIPALNGKRDADTDDIAAYINVQLVMASNQKVVGGSDNILYLPLGGDANRTRIPTEAPVLRMPATQAASEPEPQPRDTRRQGGR